MSTFLERQEVRRKRSWAGFIQKAERISLSVMIVLAGLFAVYGLYKLVFLSSYFSINDIVVRGHWSNLNAKSLIEISEVEQGDNLFFLNVDKVHDRLMTNPWVREASVRRNLPHTLLVTVEEHRPRAVIMKSDGMYYVDNYGEIFKKLEAGDVMDVPFVSGLASYLNLYQNEGNVEERFVEGAFRIMSSFERLEFGRKRGIAEVHFDLVRGFSVITDAQPIEVLLGVDDPTDSLLRLDRMEQTIRSRGGMIQYILADEPGRVIVKYRTNFEEA